MDADRASGQTRNGTQNPERVKNIGGPTPLNAIISSFRPTKLFRREDIKDGRPLPYIRSLDYDDKGEFLMTSETDDTIQIYNVAEGRHDKALVTKKYGVKLAKFTRTSSSIVFASTQRNDAIRYLSTHDNSFIRYFEGHEASVTCLAMHPGTDQFISCSLDNSVMLWDVKSRQFQGKLLLQNPCLAAWDPSGQIFAVGCPSSGTVLLYDHANFDMAPVMTVDLIDKCRHVDAQFIVKGWTKLEFSNNGRFLLVGTRGGGHFVMDAMDGGLRAYLRKPDGGTRRPAAGEAAPANGAPCPPGSSVESSGDCSFTPDGCYVVSGSKKDVLVWDLMAPAGADQIVDPAWVLDDKREAAVVAFNPRVNFFATADQELMFWVPDPHG